MPAGCGTPVNPLRVVTPFIFPKNCFSRKHNFYNLKKSLIQIFLALL